MIRILLLSLATLVMSQPSQDTWFWNLFQQTTVDSLHGYAVQYDDAHDIIIFVDPNSCFIVEADSDRYWDVVITNKEALYSFTEHVFNQILNNEHLTHLSHREATETYDSRLEQWECDGKPISKVSYRQPA